MQTHTHTPAYKHTYKTPNAHTNTHRVTIHSLFYLKWQIDDLIKKCRRSKFQVIFRPRFLDHLPKFVLKCLFKQSMEDGVDTGGLHEALGEKVCSRSDPLAEKPKMTFAAAVDRARAANSSKVAARKRWKE